MFTNQLSILIIDDMSVTVYPVPLQPCAEYLKDITSGVKKVKFWSSQEIIISHLQAVSVVESTCPAVSS